MPCLVFRRRFTILKSVQYVRSFHKRTIVLVSWTSKDILIIFGECCTRMGSLVLWSCRQSRGLSRAVVPVLGARPLFARISSLSAVQLGFCCSDVAQQPVIMNVECRMKGERKVKHCQVWSCLNLGPMLLSTYRTTPFDLRNPKKMFDLWHFLLDERRLTQVANLYSCVFHELFSLGKTR